jgi:hypothetical protein
MGDTNTSFEGWCLGTILSLNDLLNPSPTQIRTVYKDCIRNRLEASDMIRIKEGNFSIMIPFFNDYVKSLSTVPPGIDYRVPISNLCRWTVNLCGLVHGQEIFVSNKYKKVYHYFERQIVTDVINQILEAITTTEDVTAYWHDLYISSMECLRQNLSEEEKADGYVKLELKRNTTLTIATNYETGDGMYKFESVDNILVRVNIYDVRIYKTSERSALNVLLMRAKSALNSALVESKHDENFIELLRNYRLFRIEMKRYKKKGSLVAKNKELLNLFRGKHSLCGTDRLMAVSNVLKQGMLMSTVCAPNQFETTQRFIIN